MVGIHVKNVYVEVTILDNKLEISLFTEASRISTEEIFNLKNISMRNVSIQYRLLRVLLNH